MNEVQPGAPLLSIVIPARNESENVEPLAAEIRRALDGAFDYELIFVDDGSTDATWETLRGLVSGGRERLRALRLEEGPGQSFAILAGAREARGTWLVVLDADGQNDPADIPGMVRELIDENARDPRVVGVIGHRVNRRDDWVRRVSSRVANAFRNAVLRDGVPDIGCGLKALRRDWYLRLPAFDHMHRYVPTLVKAQGGVMRVRPVNHRPRRAGRSKYGVGNRLWVGLVDVLGVLWLKRRSRGVVAGEALPRP